MLGIKWAVCGCHPEDCKKTPPHYHAQIALYKNVAVGASSLEEDKLFLKILYIIPRRP